MKNEPWRGLPMERVKHLEQKLHNKKDQIRKLEAERDALREKLERAVGLLGEANGESQEIDDE